MSPESISLSNSTKERVTIPCGKCLGCMQEKRDSWVFRIKEEYKICKGALFVTLTYSEEKVPLTIDGIQTLYKRDAQLYLKRLRASIERGEAKYQPIRDNSLKGLKMPKIRYYLVGEYGENTLRPHYHAVIFNVPRSSHVTQSWSKFNNKKQKFEPLGYVHIGHVSGASINYIAKYVIKTSKHFNDLKDLRVEPEFSIMSKGIGKNYMERTGMYHKKTLITFVKSDSKKLKLPRYYSDKIFNDNQKETIKQNNQKYADKKEKETHEKLAKKGNNPYKYELDQKIDSIKKSNKIKQLKSKL